MHDPSRPESRVGLEFSGVAIDQILEGKIVEEWVYFNVLDILLPMGLTLTPPQPPQPETK